MNPPVSSAPTTAARPGAQSSPCSVIIPTFNPRPDVLQAVLGALRAQTLPLADWELVIVDNGSRPAVETLADLSWHPAARCVREEQPGGQYARARGLRESRGELVVNVDDDNVLAPDYLEQALAVARDWPHLGVWGGRIHADFESSPPEWLESYSHHLAICEFDRPVWSSFVDDRSMPYGAGMCIRRGVVGAYLERFDTGDFQVLGRHEGSFVAGEDQVIAYAALAAGLAVGRFPQLEMHHRISPRRFDPKYLLRLVRGNAHGYFLVQILHGVASRRSTHVGWPLLKLLASPLLHRGMRRKMVCAEALGQLDALRQARRLAKRPAAREEKPTAVSGALGSAGAAPAPGR